MYETTEREKGCMNNAIAIRADEVVETFFRPCPFCGCGVNVFQVPEDRYGKEHPYGWTVECKNMGCIFTRPLPDQSLQNLVKRWNKRYE